MGVFIVSLYRKKGSKMEFFGVNMTINIHSRVEHGGGL